MKIRNATPVASQEAESDNEYSVVVPYNGVDVNVKKLISFSEMISFVNYVTEACFGDSNGSFLPEAKDFAIRKAVFELYTDVEVPEDANDAYMYLYENDNLFKIVISEVNQAQISSIFRAIGEKIDANLKENISEFEYQVNKFVESIKSLSASFEEAFKDMSPGEIRNVMNILSGAAFDIASKEIKK